MKNTFYTIISFFLILFLFIIFGFLQSIHPYLGLFSVFGLIFLFILLFYIFKEPFYGILLLIFFLPFERIPSYEIFGMNLRINQIVAFLTLISFFLGNLVFGKFKLSARGGPALGWKKSLWFYPLGLFLLSSFISAYFAQNQIRAISVFIFTFFMILICWLIFQIVDSKEKLFKVFQVLFLITIFVCLFSIFQFLGNMVGLPDSLTLIKEGYGKEVFGFPRVHAFSMEPLYLANFLILPISLAFSFFYLKTKEFNPFKIFLLLILILFIFILTISRGAYVALFFSFLIILILIPKSVLSFKNILLFGFLFIFSGLVFWGIISKIGDKAITEFKAHLFLERREETESTVERLKAYQNAYQAFLEAPLFGIGPGNFGPYVKNYPDERPEWGWDIVNNEYLEILAEEGLLGAFFFFIFLIIVFYRSVLAFFRCDDRFLKASLVGLFTAFVGFLAQYNFFSTLYIIHIWVGVGLLLACQEIILTKEKNSKS